LDFCGAPDTIFFLRGILEWHLVGFSLASFSPAKSPAKGTELSILAYVCIRIHIHIYTYICINIYIHICSDSKRWLLRCLPNTSTFVPNDRLQCLYCVLPIMRCAFGAHRHVGLAERRTPCRFVGNIPFPSLFLGEDDRLYKTESLIYLCIHIYRCTFMYIMRYTMHTHVYTYTYMYSHIYMYIIYIYLGPLAAEPRVSVFKFV